MVDSPNSIWRDYNTDGVPSSGAHNPLKSKIRQWAAWVDAGLNAGTLNGPWKATKSALDSDLAYDTDTVGFVYETADIGTYVKSGASGSGSWTKVLDFIPGFQLALATDDGSSTANAHTMDTAPRASTGDGVTLIRGFWPETNTSATVTIAFDGGTALGVKTQANNDPAIGGLVQGAPFIGQIAGSGTEFRLLSDQTSSAIQTAAEAAQSAAEAANASAQGHRNAAEAAAAAAAQKFFPVRVVDTTGADPATAYEAGDTIDGVTLATSDHVLRATSGGAAADGVYVVPASGAASRASAFDEYDDYPGSYFSVMEGTTNAETLWRVTSDQGGTLDTTPIEIEEFAAHGLPSPTANTFLVANSGGTDRENKTFAEVRALLDVPTNLTALGQNYVPNGDFRFYRSAASQTTSGFGSDDDWKNEHSGSSKTHAIGTFALGQTAVPGYPDNFSLTTVTSSAGAANYVLKRATLGRLRDIAGKTVTLTLWAYRAEGAADIAAEIRYLYGTGGTPSADESAHVETITIGTTWTKHTVSINLPSLSGKTLGTNADDVAFLFIWFDAGSDYNSRTNSLGQQSGNFGLANVSLTDGDRTGLAVPWQRFAHAGPASAGFGFRRPGVANIYSTIEFYRNPGTPLTNSHVAQSWAFPGSALTASTHSLPVGARMKLVSAWWWLIWTPNSAGAGTAVRLIKADAGPANIEVIHQVPTATGASPINTINDITDDMIAYLKDPEAGTNRKTIGQQVYGDGTNGPLIYASWIECLWDVSPD